MCRSHVLIALSVTIATVRVLGQSDVTLTCPQDWSENMPVTLFCEVSKNSVTTKCTTAPQTTFFKCNGGSLCTVDPADYSSCNFGTPSTTSCGCRQNSTHYTFVYYISSPGKEHDGDWDCDKSCKPPSGFVNPLTKYINPFCTGVKVATADKECDCRCQGVFIGCIVPAELVFIALVVVVSLRFICECINERSFPKKTMIITFAIMVVVVVILLTVGTIFACKDADFPQQCPCFGECVAAIVIVLLDVVVAVIIAVVISCK